MTVNGWTGLSRYILHLNSGPNGSTNIRPASYQWSKLEEKKTEGARLQLKAA